MQVKVFEAADMASGLKMVKDALGPDALILSTRTVRSSKFGRLGKPMMEITAAIDSPWPEPAPRKAPDAQPWRIPHPEQLSRDGGGEITYQDIWARPEEKFASAPGQHRSGREENAAAGDIQAELAELRSMVKGLSSRLGSLDRSALRPAPYVEPEFTPARAAEEKDPVLGFLTGFGINSETARVVARFTRDTIAQARRLDDSELQSILRSAIARLFTTDRLLEPRPGRQRRISLIGPTGAGKTTTLAKIAAHWLSASAGRIGLITIDTYRIAAVEQLKVYAEIMRLPLEVVITPRELEQALARFADYDLVLIDTAGRSPKSSRDIQELASFLQPRLGIDNNLVLSATTRERELEETIRCFSILPISHFIFSKLDECDQLGVLLNIHYKKDTPISFLTNGQRVPEDLLIPSPRVIADLIMNDHGSLNNG